jgi:hypothetical protein
MFHQHQPAHRPAEEVKQELNDRIDDLHFHGTEQSNLAKTEKS